MVEARRSNGGEAPQLALQNLFNNCPYGEEYRGIESRKTCPGGTHEGRSSGSGVLQYGPPTRQPSINPYHHKRHSNSSDLSIDSSSKRSRTSSNDEEDASGLDTEILKQIAFQINSGNVDTLDFEEEEWQIIENCERGGNTKQYMETQRRLEQKCFDTIETYGGSLLAPLIEIVTATYDPSGETRDYAFYNVLSGEKCHSKHAVLNQVLILLGMKWKKKKGDGKKASEPLQPNTQSKYFQQLFYVFKRKGILYDFKDDFNKEGDFHGVMIDLWKKYRKLDASYGTNKNRKRVRSDYLDLIIQAIETGNLLPEKDPNHLLWLVVFILGYYCALRGRSEHADLKRDDCTWGCYRTQDGADLAGLDYFGIAIPYSKMVQLKLNKTSLDANAKVLLTVAEDPSHPTWNPLYYLRSYWNKCHPQAQKLYCKVGGKRQIPSWSKEFGIPIWYGPSEITGRGFEGASCKCNIGKNQIPKMCQTLAKLCGVENWEDVSGHALRALHITKQVEAGVAAASIAHGARQKSIKSMISYVPATGVQEANRTAALAPDRKMPAAAKKTATKEEDSIMLSPDSESLWKLEMKKKELQMRIDIQALEAQVATPSEHHGSYHRPRPSYPPQDPPYYRDHYRQYPPPLHYAKSRGLKCNVFDYCELKLN